MMSDERSSNQRRYPDTRYPQSQAYGMQKPSTPEETLKSHIFQIERKSFALLLKENSRGRFLRISEESQGRRNSIIVPASGLEEFRKALEDVLKAAETLPPAPGSTNPPQLG
jgi:hypothetical protein